MPEAAAPTYHHLTAADLADARALQRVYGEAFADIPTHQHRLPSDAYLVRLLSQPNTITVVAKINGAVVGGLTAYVLEKFEQERREIYVYDLAVDVHYRRQGIAKGIINTLRAIAADLGVYVMFIQADPVDAPAISLYDSLGKKEAVFHFDIAVP